MLAHQAIGSTRTSTRASQSQEMETVRPGRLVVGGFRICIRTHIRSGTGRVVVDVGVRPMVSFSQQQPRIRSLPLSSFRTKIDAAGFPPSARRRRQSRVDKISNAQRTPRDRAWRLVSAAAGIANPKRGWGSSPPVTERINRSQQIGLVSTNGRIASMACFVRWNRPAARCRC